jgi:hypothetical protein
MKTSGHCFLRIARHTIQNMNYEKKTSMDETWIQVGIARTIIQDVMYISRPKEKGQQLYTRVY